MDPQTLGVFFLLGVILAVMGAFIAFFLHLHRQTRTAADRELDREWAALQRDSRNAWRRHPQAPSPVRRRQSEQTSDR